MENIGQKDIQEKDNSAKTASQKPVQPIATKPQSPKQLTGIAVSAEEYIEPKFFKQRPPKQQKNIRQEETEVTVEQLQKIKKLFSSGLHLFASYAPGTKNGNYLIYLNLTNALQRLHNKLSQKDLQEYTDEEHLIGFIQIFGREIFAKTTQHTNCKAIFLDLDENLRVRLPKLWQFIHLQALNKVFYDSENPKIKIRCVSEDIQLVPNDTFKDYRLVYGAEEIEVQLIDHTTSNESQYIRLDTESYSVSKNVISKVFSKKFYTFKSKRFDFYKIFDVFNENENDYFDKYVYKQLKGVVYVGSKKIEFNIPIPCYQRLLRLSLEIIGDSHSLRVVVRDADFDAKEVFYYSAIEGQE